jgi:prepilin-type N-terminal cleavage/methylation domain-containing protein
MRPTKNACRAGGTDEAGFTLVETAVALVITTVVVAAGYASYQFATRLVADWKQSALLENAAHRIVRDISTQMRTATDFLPANKSTSDTGNGYRLLFKQKEGGGRESTVRYVLNGTSLKRNGQSMHASSVSVLRMELTSLKPNQQAEQGCFKGGGASNTSDAASRLVRLYLEIATRGDTLGICTAIHPRGPTPW